MALTFPQGSTFGSVLGSRAMGSIGRGGGGGAGTLTPAMPTNWSAAYGGIPQVPSPGATSADAIASNLSNLSQLYRLGGGINTFNQQQMESNLASAIPGYEGLTQQSSRNIQSALSGDLPQDVVNQILQRAAERGIGRGTYGSDNDNAAFLRALGLTSLEQTRAGEQMLSGAVARSPQAPLFNIPSMMPSPEDWQSAQMAANLYRSAPVPREAYRASAGAGGGGPNVNWANMGPQTPPIRTQLPSFGTGQWGSTPIGASLASSGPAPYVGNAVGPFAPTQEEIYANWSNWASGIPTQQQPDWFYDPSSFGYWDLNTGQFSETGPDTQQGTFYAGSAEDYLG